MDLNLNNKIALVSGSSRGIGKAIALGLLEEGATVYLTGRDRERLDSACLELSGRFKGRVFKFNGDLRDAGTIKGLIDIIIRDHKRLDIVVANIGAGSFKPGWDIDDDQWAESFEINFFSAVRLSREALRPMGAQGSGTIVFTSSIAGCEAIPAPVQYSTAKSALLSYVKNTADLVAPLGVRLNAVSPGNIYSEGGTWDAKLKEDKTAVEEFLQTSVPMQRLGKTSEVADAVCFLVSERASFITGANLVVDGGQIRRVI